MPPHLMAAARSRLAPAAQPRAAERILAVARDLFYRVGIRAVGVDEIVRQAGVTKPSLYRSFPSKDELAASYLRAIRARILGALRRGGRGRHPGDPRKQIVAFPVAASASARSSRTIAAAA